MNSRVRSTIYKIHKTWQYRFFSSTTELIYIYIYFPSHLSSVYKMGKLNYIFCVCVLFCEWDKRIRPQKGLLRVVIHEKKKPKAKLNWLRHVYMEQSICLCGRMVLLSIRIWFWIVKTIFVFSIMKMLCWSWVHNACLIVYVFAGSTMSETFLCIFSSFFFYFFIFIIHLRWKKFGCVPNDVPVPRWIDQWK